MTETTNTEKMTLLSEMRVIDVIFLAHVDKRNSNPQANRMYIEHHPRAYWDSTEVYTLSIHCKENYHGDYYLHLSKGADDKWFCFLINGKWSQTFIHLRHIKFYEELEEIVWALTRCKIFKSRFDMEDYVKTNYPRL